MDLLKAALDPMTEQQTSNWLPTGAAGFKALQHAQFVHDERYHREISRLSVKERLTHMALHFAKYAGRFAEGVSEESLRRLIADVFIIGVSTANSLNLSVYDQLVSVGPPSASEVEAFGRTLTVHAGRMAAACEKLDHLESFSYREVIQDAAINLIRAALGAARDRNWDIESLTRERLQPIKEKWLFHDL